MNDNRYEDIIHLPHHQSECRPKMSVRDRAAQFAPFAALVGYEQMVQETEGVLLADRRRILSEDERSTLDRKMQILQEQIAVHPEIEVTYFIENFIENEMGGAYAVYAGRIRRIENVPAAIVFMDGKRIWVGDIACMESGIFERYEL